jgi:hypothetical protein
MCEAPRLEQLGRFLLRGLRIGASTVSIVELLRSESCRSISCRCCADCSSSDGSENQQVLVAASIEIHSWPGWDQWSGESWASW